MKTTHRTAKPKIVNNPLTKRRITLISNYLKNHFKRYTEEEEKKV